MEKEGAKNSLGHHTLVRETYTNINLYVPRL